MRLDAKASLQDLVFNNNDPNGITDAFCFVVGYTLGEIKRQQAILFDEHMTSGNDAPPEVQRNYSELSKADAAVRAAWKAFMDEPGHPAGVEETNGRLAAHLSSTKS